MNSFFLSFSQTRSVRFAMLMAALCLSPLGCATSLPSEQYYRLEDIEDNPEDFKAIDLDKPDFSRPASSKPPAVRPLVLENSWPVIEHGEVDKPNPLSNTETKTETKAAPDTEKVDSVPLFEQETIELIKSPALSAQEPTVQAPSVQTPSADLPGITQLPVIEDNPLPEPQPLTSPPLSPELPPETVLPVLDLFSQSPPPLENPLKAKDETLSAAVEQGQASWYGKYHHGRKTASGQRFDMHKFTAAHKSLPLLSKVKVTNLSNGRYAVVQINDRGPFVKGRILDVSYAVSKHLGFHAQGHAKVQIEPLTR